MKKTWDVPVLQWLALIGTQGGGLPAKEGENGFQRGS